MYADDYCNSIRRGLLSSGKDEVKEMCRILMEFLLLGNIFKFRLKMLEKTNFGYD